MHLVQSSFAPNLIGVLIGVGNDEALDEERIN